MNEGLSTFLKKHDIAVGSLTGVLITSLMDEATAGLTEGRIIRLSDLGSMRNTLSSEGREKSEQVTEADVKKAGVIFTPGKKLQDMLKTVKFTKV